MKLENVLIHVEIAPGKMKKPSLEALGEARRLAAGLGGSVSAVIVGEGARGLASSLEGAAAVFALETASPQGFHLSRTADAVVEAARKAEAGIIILSATSTGREVAAAVAADLGTCVAADVIEVRVEGGQVTARRPVYAGKAILTVRSRRLPIVLTLRPNLFAPEPGGAPPARVESLSEGAGDARARVVETIEPEVVKQDLAEADIIVSGGRGLKGPENFGLIEGLASTLGAAVGASRAVCDAGWRPHSEQVGQTGRTVSPRLYVACGISGAIQHLAGMSSSKCIVAINKDPHAPIFQVADYGITGDVFEIIPALDAELKKMKG